MMNESFLCCLIIFLLYRALKGVFGDQSHRTTPDHIKVPLWGHWRCLRTNCYLICQTSCTVCQRRIVTTLNTTANLILFQFKKNQWFVQSPPTLQMSTSENRRTTERNARELFAALFLSGCNLLMFANSRDLQSGYYTTQGKVLL